MGASSRGAERGAYKGGPQNPRGRRLRSRGRPRNRNVASADPAQMAAATPYQKNVFINCPFDRTYRAIFDALVFAVHDAGYIARSAQEVRDTGEVRIEKILRLV